MNSAVHSAVQSAMLTFSRVVSYEPLNYYMNKRLISWSVGGDGI